MVFKYSHSKGAPSTCLGEHHHKADLFGKVRDVCEALWFGVAGRRKPLKWLSVILKPFPGPNLKVGVNEKLNSFGSNIQISTLAAAHVLAKL